MTPTPVGMRCPECSRDRTKVRTLRTAPSAPTVTQALILINVLVFIVEVGTGTSLGGSESGTLIRDGGLSGPAIAHQHEYYRLVTSGFLHYSLLHILFNMVFLYIMGPMLEPAIGRVNFAAVYLTALLAGAFGAILFEPDALTVGASGAAFGVLGALIVVAWDRGISIWQTGLGPTLLINVVFSFSVAGISIGGHLGGLIGGGLAGWLIVQFAEKRRRQWVALAGCLLLAAASVGGAIAVASSHGLTPGGVGFGG
jgi:membrane associated rhomboid family serine protease